MKARGRAYRAANPEKHKAATTAWRAANKERFAEVKRQYRADNPEKVREARRLAYLTKGEAERSAARAWKRQNAAKVIADMAKRTALKKKAVPVWANMTVIKDVYRQARELTIATGIKHHVDHIVPLKSDIVCGLHCEANLQILTAFDNQSKKNRWWPDMPAQTGVPT